MPKNNLFTGADPTISHGKGKLADPPQANPQDHASVGVTNDGPGRGEGRNSLGSGERFSSGSIQHIPPGKGSGASMGLDDAKAKGVPHPMGAADTKP